MTSANSTASSVLIVAFDGLIIESVSLRVDALHAVLESDGRAASRDRIAALLPGRSLAEAIRAVDPATDESRLDLVVMQAQKAISRRMAQGVDLTPSARRVLDSVQSKGVRVIARSDSLRRDVDRALMMSGLEQVFAFVRCADDAPRMPGATMIDSAYRAIVRRLESTAIVGSIRALEFGEDAASSASRHVTHARCVHTLI